MPTLWRLTRLVVLLAFVGLFVACTTVRERADHAYETGKHDEALQLYERIISEGTRDPDVYLRAAEAALNGGSFSAAERYYSQALRYGGGLNVAKRLADFYVKTSNYVSAVRVYQYLLFETDQPQPVYNNLGTALMYAGKPFDAESYLLIAQQLDPEDPFPYVNLGLLYDRHLKQPWLAINFYECFIEMAGRDAEKRRMVRQRISEIKKRWGRLYEPGVVTCGEIYQPKQSRVVDLEDHMPDDEETKDGDGEGDSSSQAKTPPEGEPPESPPVIERMVTEDVSSDDEEDGKRAGIEAARKAFQKGRHNDVVDLLTELSVKELGTGELEMLGASLLELGRVSEAITWLETAQRRKEKPQTIALLVGAYLRSDDAERLQALCDRYRDRDDFDDATEECPPKKSAEESTPSDDDDDNEMPDPEDVKIR